MSPSERRNLRAAVAVGFSVLVGIVACSSHQLIDGAGGGSGRSVGGNACAPGVQGCPCDTGGQTVACGHVVNRFTGYVTCSEGMSTCQSGTWSACQGDRVFTKSVGALRLGSGGIHIESNTSACTDPCNPNTCTQITDGPSDLDASAESGFTISEGGITLGSGSSGGSSDAASDGGATDSGASCNCKVSVCDGGNGTTITGKVFDPAGNNVLYNAWVYVPLDTNAALPAFTQGLSCDNCATGKLQTQSVAVTATDGTFTLTHVPDGTNVPIVVQMGKWRRKITLATVNPCTNNPIADGVLHLPRSRTDGDNNTADIPQIAFVSGKADPFECMLLKTGLDPNEFGSLTKNSNRRIHYYNSPDKPDLSIDPSFGNVITGDTMWNSPTNLALYDIVILACESVPTNNPNKNSVVSGTTTGYQNLTNWSGLGGRAFLSHYNYTWMRYNAPWAGVPASWIGTIKTQDPMFGTIVTAGFPKGQALSQWLTNVGGSVAVDGGVGTGGVSLYQAHQSSNRPLSANAQEWVTATDNNGGSPPLYSPDFVFNTPLGAASASQCGRVTFSDVHVGAQDLLSADSSGNVSCLMPSDCGIGSTGCVGSAPGGCSHPPAGGWCYDATDCTGAGGSGTCTGSTLPKCAKNTACTQNSQCKSNSCNVGTGICNTPPFCNPNTAGSCGTSEKCTGGTKGNCGCWQNAYCATTNSSGTSWGNYCNTPSPTNGTCQGNGNNFPYGCAQGKLDSQEDLLEFHLFDLSSCISPDNATPPAPPVPVIVIKPATFTVDFTSSCPSGTHVAWRELDWQATIPNTASIAFSAKTADAPSDGGPVDYSSAQSVPLTTATTTTASLPTGWDSVLIDVVGSGKFNSASPVVVSKNSLRLTVTMTPTSDMKTSPTLIQWKVRADCPPTE
jgi:hypothetical protein